ncbi:aminoglycoside phosphotransferase family protein [Daejeonia sp. YH14]|uniref:aminoglycoside phosphotransferase family protein n=1 Tax=Daejeonia sp. YH14 TaxID=3439042 RepID=UPI003F498458
MPKPAAEIFFEDYNAAPCETFVQLPQSGSSRKNYLATAQNRQYIITENSNIAENDSFLYFSEVFSDLKLNTPEIYAVSQDHKMYIQEFLGSSTLSDMISKEGTSEHVRLLVKKTLEKLFELQQKTNGKIDYSRTFEYAEYDSIPVMHDLFYFKFMFADLVEVQYHKSRLIREFQQIVQRVETLQPRGLMIRDFQSRNIMVLEDEVFFIDYQSAMKGPLMYDVTSFLYQAKAHFPENFRQDMLEYYYSLWENQEQIYQLKESLPLLQLMRFLQVLGGYGFRGLVQRKPHFVQSIHQGIENIYQHSELWDGMKAFPELKSVICQLHSAQTTAHINSILESQS